MGTEQIFESTFDALVNEDYSIPADIERYQAVLEHASLKVDFSIDTEIYRLPSYFNLNI